MRIFKLMAIALVAMIGLNSCSKDSEQEFIEVDHSKDLVGTWTCLEENYAEALVINADGSVVSTGVEDGKYWEDVKGNIKTVNNKMTLTFEDNDNFEGRFEMLSGEAFTIFEEDGKSFTYRYCANDFSDEIVGMWVSMDKAFGNEEESVIIFTYDENGKTYFTGFAPEIDGYFTQAESSYKIIGDLKISSVEGDSNTPTKYLVNRINIIPNGTEYGDIMTTHDMTYGTTPTFLRIKQTLDFNIDKKYDYSSVYISNAKGSDFTIMDYTFDASMADGSRLDAMLKHLLFCVEFPTPNTIKYKYRYNNNDVPFEAPITVDGNKVTIDMTVINSAYRKVDVYMFQDQDNTQMHMYMPTSGFINYFGNMQLTALNAEGKINLGDAAAVEKVFADLDACVESINLSLVFKARK
ncbi:MAG: hypothetical protein IIX34_02490 [Alistipes sp.]|nr:hypothetical protein [Alistipes sp.]